MKKYDAVYFDWDGTAVISRNDDARPIARVMDQVLSKGIKLIIISGTTYNNIAGGELHTMISPENLKNLFLGLGRGAYQYAFINGEPLLLQDLTPSKDWMLKLHRHCYAIHEKLYKEYNYNTDVVFCRTNYCKIDLLPNHSRGSKLFLQNEEIQMVEDALTACGFTSGMRGLIDLAASNPELPTVKATADAKHLEVGFTTKGDNVDYFVAYLQKEYGITLDNSAFIGDEFADLQPGVLGADAMMITDITRTADFFDVSCSERELPKEVARFGGGVDGFRSILEEQLRLHN